MTRDLPGLDPRVTLAINLELRHGRHGAAARIELHPVPSGSLAVVRLRGRLDEIALDRLSQALRDLAARDVRHLLIDCSELSDIPAGLVGALGSALAPFEPDRGRYALCGLSPRLRERFRFAGPGSGLHPATSAAELLAPTVTLGASREWAS